MNYTVINAFYLSFLRDVKPIKKLIGTSPTNYHGYNNYHTCRRQHGLSFN